MQHALGSASILIGLHMDHETIAATALHAVPEYLDDWAEVLTERFGRNVTVLVDGISRMEHIRQFSEMRSPATKDKDDTAEQIESLRKMLLAMVEDIRVVLIKLAERTQTLRNLSGATPEQQIQIAQETQSIFAPLANRLGVWQIKWELEDLSTRYLEPTLYKQVAKLLDERRVDRERYIADVIAQLQQALVQAGIKAEVSGRPKHIYSIINKMKRKHLDFDQLYDVRAVRVLVDDLEQCYAALSIVHELWQPIQSEFDDYIARPKPQRLPFAAYRSARPARSFGRSADTHAADASRFRTRRGCALALQGEQEIRERRGRKNRLAAPDSGVEGRIGRQRGAAGTVQERTAAGPRICADAARQGDRSAQRRDAGGFCLRGAYRSRPPHARRQDRRQHRAAQHQTAEQASAWRSSPPSRAGPAATGSARGWDSCKARGHAPRCATGSPSRISTTASHKVAPCSTANCTASA